VAAVSCGHQPLPGTGSGGGGAPSTTPGGGAANPNGGAGNPNGGAGNPTGGAVMGSGGDNVITIGGGAGGAGGAPAKVSCTSSTQDPLPYTGGYKQDPAIHQAALALAGQLSVEERAQQMRGLPQSGDPNYNVFNQEDNATKNIKGFYFRDGPRGVNLNANGDGKADYCTSFPVAIARGAAFDTDLEYHIGQAIGDETLVSGNTMILAPTVNILRHPAWGRAQETYGEDPFLLGRLGSAFVVGVQEYVAACVKHFAANNIENGRETANATIDEQTLREIYGRHYEMIVKEGGVSSVMAAYNQVNGTYSTLSKHLLTDMLRTDMGFQGFVLTDWWAMPNGNQLSALSNPATLQGTARDAVNAGLDLEMPWSFNYSTLSSLVSAGQLTGEQLTAAAARVIEQKMRFKVDKRTGPLGLKTPSTTFNTGTSSVENNQAHIDLATQAAIESMVLLKNEKNTLPINKATVHSIAVIGANVSVGTLTVKSQDGSTTIDFSTNVRTGDLGSSRVFADPAKSFGPFAGIQAAAGAGITVTKGNTAAAAAAADFVVVVAGLTPFDEGEEYTKAGDRSSFALDAKGTAVQNALIASVAALNKPMVVVLEGGSVIDMPWLASVPAVVMAWYPGMTGGKALGNLLMGDANFSGKLPLSWPAAWADEPELANSSGTTVMDSYLGYRWFDRPGNTTKPLFAFGFGLSYTSFNYSNLQVPCADVPKDGVVNVSVDVNNTGTKAGDEVVFLFVSYPSAGAVRRPAKELKGFTRVSLAAPDPANPANGSAKRVIIPLRVKDLKYWDTANNKWDVQTGPVQVLVGPSSDKLTLMDTFTVK
ncbi:MAG: glycoside hydrolase family 3 N-terminal domain-containing protein, partial [Polyangiaceae bacterium]